VYADAIQLRGKKITEVLLSAIFALGVLALVAVWAGE